MQKSESPPGGGCFLLWRRLPRGGGPSPAAGTLRRPWPAGCRLPGCGARGCASPFVSHWSVRTARPRSSAGRSPAVAVPALARRGSSGQAYADAQLTQRNRRPRTHTLVASHAADYWCVRRRRNIRVKNEMLPRERRWECRAEEQHWRVMAHHPVPPDTYPSR